MRLQLKQVILWARRPNLAPRIVTFNAGSVNVVSGVSRTGKSAIIPIIDYCLGSDRCTVPVQTIRNACEWFGIIVETEEGDKLFARREPGELRSTGDMYVASGKNLQPPSSISGKNTTVEAVKHELDQLAGLSTLDFDPDSPGGFRARPSFRDLGAFLFQPQNVVANPNVLFYKTDTTEHREKLRTIFPYVLGAVNPETLAKRHQLKLLRRELRRKEEELRNVRTVSQRWVAEAQARVSEAIELGLLTASTPRPQTHRQAIGLLRRVMNESRSETSVTAESISEAVSELTSLNEEEAEISQDVSRLRRRFEEMSQLKSSAAQYRGALRVQQDRLAVADWVRRHQEANHSCPMCGSSFDVPNRQLAELLASLRQIEDAAAQFDGIPASFDREFERVRAEIAERSEQLRGVRIRIRDLERRSEEARRRQYSLLMSSRFLGRLESDLSMLESVGQDSELQSEVDELRERVQSLEAEISEAQIRRRIDRALDIVNQYAGRLMPGLDAERPNDPVALSDSELTIKVRSVDREDFLWEIGSGSNWLSYHVSMTLALQQFFLTLPHSPVPSFLIFDQPSQVYFPKRLVDRPDSGAPSEPEWRDEDVEAVRKVFQTLSQVVQQVQSRLQVIVLDHAPEAVWRGIAGVHLVEDWRDGRKLVPEEWIAN